MPLVRGPRPTDVSEFLDGSKLAHIAKLLQPFFAPASYLLPPGASPTATGNRVIAINTQTQNQPKLQDSAVIDLVAGELTWSFKTKFTIPPSVNPSPQGAPPSAGTTLYIHSVAPNEVIVKSTDATDARTVHLQASQPAEGD